MFKSINCTLVRLTTLFLKNVWFLVGGGEEIVR